MAGVAGHLSVDSVELGMPLPIVRRSSPRRWDHAISGSFGLQMTSAAPRRVAVGFLPAYFDAFNRAVATVGSALTLDMGAGAFDVFSTADDSATTGLDDDFSSASFRKADFRTTEFGTADLGTACCTAGFSTADLDDACSTAGFSTADLSAACSTAGFSTADLGDACSTAGFSTADLGDACCTPDFSTADHDAAFSTTTTTTATAIATRSLHHTRN